MKIKKIMAVLLSMTFITGAMAGCGKNETSDNSSTTAAVEESADTKSDESEADSTAGAQTGAQSQEEKHIKIFTNLSEANVTYSVWEDILTAYQQEVNPNFTWEIEVVSNHDQYLDKLKLYIAGGDMPDIYQIPNGPLSVQLAGEGKMVNIGEELKTMGMYDTYNEGCIDFLKFYDGELYLFPDGRYAELFWYWKDTFEKYDLEAPETYDAFLEVCKVLKENGESPITMAGKESWQALRYVSFMPWVTTNSTFINTLKTGEQKYVDSEIGMQGANFLYTLAENEYFVNGYGNLGYSDNLNNFFNKQAVISYFGPNDLTSEMIDEYNSGNLGYFQVPYVDGQEDGSTNIPVHTGKAWGMNIDSYDPELQQFFEFFVTHHTEYSHAHNVFSPLDEGVPEDMEPVLTDIYQKLMEVDKGWVSWDDKLDPTTIVTSGELATELSLGLITPEEYAKEFDLSIEENAGQYFEK